ncbi:MAG TPA: hypothetical protein HA282_01865 [Nanoarchaeota archaeon]|nr:MAG: hypothetical protein QT01_C0006G0028 [archaeon GW2011_AR6]MBS3082808.1 hypothetical protein [Candidatus Pacearchaeota archaeon]HIH17989.1 hypothetical protein [Nanoarchaeota archaeon]HIH34470.1 hypothetical protein [Nanoarchaeota archaeon]HIH50974.1 hypothetical protein [Nanoarchaeota archaeon]
MNLEERLSALDASVKDGLIREMNLKPVNPVEKRAEMPEFKYNLTDAISQYLGERGIFLGNSFKDNFGKLYSGGIRKEPLQRVHYGMLSAKDVPVDVLHAVQDGLADLGESSGDYALVYFYAGMWDNYWHVVNTDRPLLHVVSDLIETGIGRLEKNYADECAKGKYGAEMQLPYSSQIKERLSVLKEEWMEKELTKLEEQQSRKVGKAEAQPALF